MKLVGRTRELWITPGGRIQAGESPVTALVRELREETGRDGFAIQGPIWVRHGTFLEGDRHREEREYFYLVPTERFEPVPAGLEAEEAKQFLGFRWWSPAEIEKSTECFVPPRIALHLRDLNLAGPPASPVDVSE